MSLGFLFGSLARSVCPTGVGADMPSDQEQPGCKNWGHSRLFHPTPKHQENRLHAIILGRCRGLALARSFHEVAIPLHQHREGPFIAGLHRAEQFSIGVRSRHVIHICAITVAT